MDFVATIIGVAISIGAVVVSLTTQLNHVAHLKADVDRHEANIKNLYIKIDGTNESISKLGTDIARDHEELLGEIKSIRGICDERHK